MKRSKIKIKQVRKEDIIAIRFNLLQVCPSVPSFVFAVLFISPFNVLRCAVFLIYFPQFGGSSYRLSEL